jgi:hypothetical protein
MEVLADFARARRFPPPASDADARNADEHVLASP